jgi:hypothetical protein
VLDSRRALLVVALLTALAVVLRALIVGQTVGFDELYLYEIVHAHGPVDVISMVHDTESTPPLHFLLAWAAARIGCDDFLWIRMPSLVLGAATVPLVYALGLRTVGRTAALVAAALFAIVPFELFYDTEARAYATIAFLSAAGTLALLEMVRTGRRRWAVAFVLITVAELYTHYTVVFVIGAQLVWALWAHRERARLVLSSYAVIALAFVPWIPSFIFQSHDSAADRIKTLYPLTVHSYVRGVFKAWLGHPFVSPRRIPGALGGLLIAVGLAGSVAGAMAGWRRSRRPLRLNPNGVLIILLALVTPIAALLYSLGPASIFLPRNLSASVPAALLGTGAVIAAARWRSLVAVTSACVLIGVGIGSVRSLGDDAQRPDFRAIAHELDRAARSGDPVLELTIFSGAPSHQLGYWFERPHDYYTTGRSIVPAFAAARRTGHFFVATIGTHNPLLSLLAMDRHGFRLVRTQTFPSFQPLALLTYVPAAGHATPRPHRKPVP